MKVVNLDHQKGNPTSVALTTVVGAHIQANKAMDTTQNVTLTIDAVAATKAIVKVPWNTVETGITITTVATTNTLEVTTNGSKATVIVAMISEDGIPMLWSPPQGLTPGSAHTCLNIRNAGARLRNTHDPRDLNDPTQKTHAVPMLTSSS